MANLVGCGAEVDTGLVVSFSYVCMEGDEVLSGVCMGFVSGTTRCCAREGRGDVRGASSAVRWCALMGRMWRGVWRTRLL